MRVWNTDIIEENEYRNVVDYDCKGFGRTITYNIFEGITLVFFYFNTEEKFKSGDYDSDIICISYCHKGRYECEFKNHQNTQLPMGYVGVYDTEYLPLSSYFPLKEYEGISIVIEESKVSNDLKPFLDIFEINLDSIKEVLRDSVIWFVRKANKDIEEIFSELYRAESLEEIGYFRIKILELFYQINRMIMKQNTELDYYKKSEIEEVKNICEKIKANLDKKISIEDLVEKSEINLRKFYDIFNQIYGTTPYAYIKKYKMNIAANHLLKTDKKIIDIGLNLGYTKPGKFTEAFKSVYEETPSEYRKKRKQERGM